MPPHSVFEWVIGQNIPKNRKNQPARCESIKIELSTDDEEDADIVTVTYPRRVKARQRNRGTNGKSESILNGKRVSFEEKPLKSALKKPCGPSSEESESESGSGGSETESGADASSEDFEPQGSRKKAKSNNGRKSKNASNKKSGNGGSDTDKNSHQNCACASCVAGRELLAKAVEAITKNSKNEEASAGGKDKEGLKKKGKEQKNKDNEKDAGNNGSETKHDEDKSKKDNKTKHGDAQSKKDGEKPKDGDKGKDENSKDSKAKENEASSRKKDYDRRHPHMIMSPRQRLLQMEHVVEDPRQDPPPNSYFDNDRGICRVYHGPYWRSFYGPADLPAGVQYPAHNWGPTNGSQSGGPPALFPGAYPAPAFVPHYQTTHPHHQPSEKAAGQQMNGYQTYPSWTGFPPQYVPYQPPHNRPPAPQLSGNLAPPPTFGISGMPPDTKDTNPFTGFSLSPLKGTGKSGLQTDSRGKGNDAGSNSWAGFRSAKGSGLKWESPKPSGWVKQNSTKSNNGGGDDNSWGGNSNNNNGGGNDCGGDSNNDNNNNSNGNGGGLDSNNNNDNSNNPSSSPQTHFGHTKPRSSSQPKFKPKKSKQATVTDFSEPDKDAGGGGSAAQHSPPRPDATQSMPGSWLEGGDNSNNNNTSSSNNDGNHKHGDWPNNSNNDNHEAGGNGWNTTDGDNNWGDTSAAQTIVEW